MVLDATMLQNKCNSFQINYLDLPGNRFWSKTVNVTVLHDADEDVTCTWPGKKCSLDIQNFPLTTKADTTARVVLHQLNSLSEYRTYCDGYRFVIKNNPSWVSLDLSSLELVVAAPDLIASVGEHLFTINGF